MIIYDDGPHTYHNEKGEQYISVTTLKKQVCPKEDWKAIAANYVNKRTNEEIIKDLAKKQGYTYDEVVKKYGSVFTPERIAEVWANTGLIATTGGSNWHDWKEIQDSTLPNTVMFPMFNGVKKGMDLKELKPNTTYLELICYYHPGKVAGQADKIITLDRTSIIRDYKCTNKELTSEVQPFWSKKNGKAVKKIKKFQRPISNVKHNNYWEYALQLSMYGYIMEIYGFPPERLVIDQVITEWIPLNEVTNEQVIDVDDILKKARIVTELKEIELPYLKKEAKALLNMKR